MDKYLVDVPVKINIWIRRDCLKKQWEVIKAAKPSVLFIQSDGGRNEFEWRIINANRKMIDETIDWDCVAYKLYEPINNGMYKMSKKTGELIWSKVDRCIFLEDDEIPSLSFFGYCAELLEKYKDDTRIYCICGMNHLGVSKDVTSDYFFSRNGSVWGTATWKRCSKLKTLDYSADKYIMSLLRERTKKNKKCWKKIKAYGEGKQYEGHGPAGEFWREFSHYSQGMLQIVPKYNMIKNVGYDEFSAHFGGLNLIPKKLRQLFNMDTYEYSFPLVHPKYVIQDDNYMEKVDRILAYNHPWIQVKRYFESVLYRVLYKLKKGFGKRPDEDSGA